ncbi:MAG TPA: hypothetical protein PKX92_10070 [Edaphocola sp.]|nr:hypothetical protein [Edaphocola sp.]
MSKLLIAIFVCMLWQTTFAQKWEIRKYYELINLAELEIVDSNYQKALNFYKEAFLCKKPNADDLANSFQTAFLIKDTAMATLLLNKLAIKGMHPTYYKNNRLFSAYNIDSNFYLYLMQDYDSLYNISISTLKPFGDSFKPFHDEDQRVRDLREKDSTINIEPFDIANEKKLYNYIRRTQFPTFENTGFWETFGRSHYQYGICWLIAWHRRPNKSILEDLLLEQVLAGNYNPETFAGIVDGQSGAYGLQLVHIGLESLSSEELKQLNDRRKAIYLESIEDYIKKSKFQFEDERFMIVNDFYNGFNKVIKKLKAQKKENEK